MAISSCEFGKYGKNCRKPAFIETAEQANTNEISKLDMQPAPERHYEKTDTIVVSMTSWPMRIQKVAGVISQILAGNLVPDRIAVNLAIPEFPNMFDDLPAELLEIADANPETCEICWVPENTKPYKKLIPTIERYPNAVIVTVDDDIVYPPEFLRDIYDEYVSWGRRCAITCRKCKWKFGEYIHTGGFALVTKDLFGQYLEQLYSLYLAAPDYYPFSDLIFTYAILLNGRRYKATDLDMGKIRMRTHSDEGAISKYGDASNKAKALAEHRGIENFIKHRYGKAYDQLVDAPVYVNVTTWPQRDKYLLPMLRHFQLQTKKPDKLYLWLSREEYNPKRLPETIRACIREGLISDIRWVNKNIYCHKRHEVFKRYPHVYNVFIDDDIKYEPDFLRVLYDSAKKHQNDVTCMAGMHQEYVGVKRVLTPFGHGGPSWKNQFLGCWMCFPPYSFPAESFEYAPTRDRWVPKCDEGWLMAWFIKKGIKVNLVYSFKNEYAQNNIGYSQKTALFNENKRVVDGVATKERMFANALLCVGVERKAMEIWPEFDVLACADPKCVEWVKNERNRK